MNMLLHFIGWVLVLLGCFAILSALIGLFKFPDFFSKIHAAGIIDSFGLPISLVGLSFLQTNVTASFKLIFAAALALILCPIATHALAKAALVSELRTKNLKELHENAR